MSILSTTGKFLLKRGPLILTAFSVIGTVAVGYFSAKGAKRSMELHEEAEEELSKKEEAVIAVKSYGVAGAVGTVTAACMIFAYILSDRQIKALSATAVAAAGAYAKYREEVVKRQGEDFDKEIIEAVHSKKEPDSDIIVSGDDVITVVEPYTGTEIRTTKNKFLEMALQMNKQLNSTAYAFSLRDILDFFGVPTCAMHDEYNIAIDDVAEFDCCTWVDLWLFPLISSDHIERYEISMGMPFFKTVYEVDPKTGETYEERIPIDANGSALLELHNN